MNEFQDLTQAIVAFRDRRNWKQFHSIKHLAAGLSIEAAELQELLLWKTDAEAEEFLHSRFGRKRLGEEIADVLIFGILLCHEAGLDPAKAIRRKMLQNAKKYPVRLARGRALKYTELRHRSATAVQTGTRGGPPRNKRR